MKKIIFTIMLSISPQVFGDELLIQLQAKLKAGDFPKGASGAEYVADKAPHLADLMEQASQNKQKIFIPVMKQVFNTPEMFWEMRQESLLYLAYFSKQKDIRQMMKKISADKNEPVEIRETAQKALKLKD